MTSSLMFKPKISFNFGSGKLQGKTKNVSREEINWTNNDIEKLVELRSLGLYYRECAKILGRSTSACGAAINSRNLYSEIKKRRQQLINEALK
tara:strand:- start:633 stop:911 length:279 start_codon:yes stop_codon:yes gene_type:complete